MEVVIQDNGEGFTERNFNYFKNLDSLNLEKEKHKFSPKGQGRLSIVHFTDTAFFESNFEDEDHELCQRNFTYPIESGLFGESECFALEKGDTCTKVTMTLNKLKTFSRAEKFFKKYETAVDLKQWVIANFMPFFLQSTTNPGKNISLDIQIDDDLASFTSKKIADEIEKIDFSINITDIESEKKERTFNIWLLKRRKISSKKINILPCARGLVVSFANRNRLEYSIDLDYEFNAFLTSDFFDQSVFNTGEKIEVNEDTYLSIGEHIAIKFDTYFAQEVMENRAKSKLNVESFQKFQPIFGMFIDEKELIGDKRQIITESDIAKSAISKKSTEEMKYWNDEKSEYTEKVLKSGLAAYIKHRYDILVKFSKMIEIQETNNPYEDKVHELICPPGDLFDGQEDYFKHNLWIVDDKFSYFSYTNSARRGEGTSDITIHAYSDNNEMPSEVVFIELKRPLKAHNAGVKSDDMTDQVTRYAKDFFRKRKGKGEFGGEIEIDTDRCRFFAYITASRKDIEKEINRCFEKHHKDIYNSIPFSKNAYFTDVVVSERGKSEKKMRIELYAYSDLEKLAKNRNKVFFKLLKRENLIER